MPRFQSFSNSEVSFVNYFGIVEVNRVIITPSMSCNIRASACNLLSTMEGKSSEVNHVNNALLARARAKV